MDGCCALTTETNIRKLMKISLTFNFIDFFSIILKVMKYLSAHTINDINEVTGKIFPNVFIEKFSKKYAIK